MAITPKVIYLASRSPRRSELLKQIGIKFIPLLFRTPPREDIDVSEDVLPNEDSQTYVMRVARLKAIAGIRRMRWRHLPPLPVLAADTTLEVDGEIIGKPANAEHAAEILRKLSGRAHTVLTSVVIAHGDDLHEALSISTVTLRELSEEDIADYIATGEPFDKAGAYGIQGRAATFISSIQGSYTGIMGLPLFETAELLRRIT